MSSTVLVTGSSRGIGFAIAQRLAQAGWKVVLHGSQPSDALARAQALLGDSCAGVLASQLDSFSAGASLWQKAMDTAGPLHALVNNAGIYLPHQLGALSQGDLSALADRIMGVNFQAPLGLTHAASRTFLAAGSGRIVQVASRVGLKGEAGASLYAASKAALLSLVKSLAVEHAAKGVRHFGIAPGWVDTAMARDGMTQRLEDILATIPYGRMATPEDCAHAVNWLLSGEADYMTGLIIDINGASYMR